MTSELIRIVMASDEGYARPLAVAAQSVLANLGPGRGVEFYFLDMGISAENRRGIERSLTDRRVNITWIDEAQKSVEGLPTFGWFTTATYARLLIPDLLPANVSRAIYLDCDLVVRRCIGDLYDAEMQEYAALAVPDMGGAFVCCPWGLANWFESGRSPADFNFNAGVLLMNLDAWRREHIGEQALAYVRSDRHELNQDQEALNAVAGTRFGPIDPRWNQQGELFQKPCAIVLPYPKDVVDAVRTDPWIIHYSLGAKPWMDGCEHPWAGEWFSYLDRTAFRGWRPPGPGRTQKAARQARKVAGRVARKLALL
jgi:lipopolysaccharide biosynthesis glycosyltransferase